MGLFESIFTTKDKNNSPDQIFQICRDTASKFPMNYIEEFDDQELNEDGFDGEYENCRRFTALLICCSIVYLKSRYKDNHEPDPFKDEFYKPFIALILKEAEKVRTITMHQDLSGGFDGEDYWLEELPDYRCMEYFKEVSSELLKTSQSDGRYLPKILAHNYYVNPGTLWFNDRESLDDMVKVNELNQLIMFATKQIMPKIM